MHFFHVNFVNARGILAQKICNVHAIFVNFLALKMGDDSNGQVPLVSWFPVSPNALELAALRKANLILE